MEKIRLAIEAKNDDPSVVQITSPEQETTLKLSGYGIIEVPKAEWIEYIGHVMSKVTAQDHFVNLAFYSSKKKGTKI